MKIALKLFLVVLGLLVLGLGLLVAAALLTEHRPAPVEPVAVACSGPGTELAVGQPFSVLSWNTQYGASRKHRFFYDGGTVVHVPPQDVAATMSAIERVIQDSQAELVLLQEIDRGSDRTQRIDQLPPLVAAAGANCQAATPYHKSPYVPTPAHQHLGRVDMELATLSRGSMAAGQRIQLALLAEPRYRQVFNLKRALLTVEVPVTGWDQPLAVANTHLSAFSYGDGTHGMQVQQLADWIRARPEGQPWVLAGDMNLLPPGFDKNSLRTESDLYAGDDNPIELLLPLGTEVLGDQLDPRNRSYLPFGASEPDRKIDYFLVGGPIQVVEARVLSEHTSISDHLPVLARLVVGDPPPKVEEAAPQTALEALDMAPAPEPPAAPLPVTVP